jgi:hypothetical protein
MQSYGRFSASTLCRFSEEWFYQSLQIFKEV